MLLILLGVLILHLIALILLIVSTAASVSPSPFSLNCECEQAGTPSSCSLCDRWLLLVLKAQAGAVDAAVCLSGSVLLCVPDLVCRWRQEHGSMVQLHDNQWGLPLHTSQQWRFVNNPRKQSEMMLCVFTVIQVMNLHHFSSRLDPGSPSPHDPVHTLLLLLPHCVLVSAVQAGQGRALLLHRHLPDLGKWVWVHAPRAAAGRVARFTFRSTLTSPVVSRPGVFVMCGAIIYTVMSPNDQPGTQFGYAYVLAWVAFPLCLISGLIYIVLRKKEWERERRRKEEGW